MNHRIGIIALLATAAAPLAAAAQSPTQTIVRIEQQWLHAKSTEEAGRFLAPDFVGVSTRGVIETREQRLARFHPAPQAPATSVHFGDLTVAFPAQNVAIATGKAVATGRTGTRIYAVAFSDTFCLRDGRWLAVHAQETLVSNTP